MSERILRINDLIRQHVNELLLTEVDFPHGCLATIVKVETSKDLRHSKIFISVLPVKYTSKVIDKLKQNIGKIQHQLKKRLSLKPLPRISFAIDRTEKEASDIEQLLDSIKESS